MTDWKDLEIKTAAQFAEWAKGAEFTAIRSDWGTPATDLFDRYAAQERGAGDVAEVPGRHARRSAPVLAEREDHRDRGRDPDRRFEPAPVDR